MKVILLNDVPNLGRIGDVKDVAPGYARNFLIPKGFATMATRGSIKQVEERQAAEARRIAKQEEELRGLSERLQGMRVQIEARVGERGRLFGSVTTSEIADAIAEARGLKVDRRKIRLEEPIREVGTYMVEIDLSGGATARVKTIVAEQK